MKASQASLLVAALAGPALARPGPAVPGPDVLAQKAVYGPDELRAYTAPHAVSMDALKQKKLDQLARDESAGVYAKDHYKSQGAADCVDGKAGEYSCNRVNLRGFLSHQDTQSSARRGNDIWGKT